jgi:hypothetical protein
MPQLPQLASSVFRFLHTPLQQVCPAGQVLPQVPQLASSICRSVQTPPQLVEPPVQPPPPPETQLPV